MSIYTEWDNFHGKSIEEGLKPLLSAMAERIACLSGKNFEYGRLEAFIPSAMLDPVWLEANSWYNYTPLTGTTFLENYQVSFGQTVYNHRGGNYYKNYENFFGYSIKELIFASLGNGLLYNFLTPSVPVPSAGYDAYYRPSFDKFWNDYFPGQSTQLTACFGYQNVVVVPERWITFDSDLMHDFARAVNVCTSAIIPTNTGRDTWDVQIVDISDQLEFKLP